MVKKILIVDDMPSVRILLKMLLKDEGYQLDEAANGLEALSKCNSGSPPDVVLMDVLMPEMDGIECCRRIKNDIGSKNISVVMITTKGEPKQKASAFAAGCDDYLTKPVDKPELISKIRQLIET